MEQFQLPLCRASIDEIAGQLNFTMKSAEQIATLYPNMTLLSTNNEDQSVCDSFSARYKNFADVNLRLRLLTYFLSLLMDVKCKSARLFLFMKDLLSFIDKS